MEFDWVSNIITGLVSAFTGWFVGRKRNDAEVESIHLNNMAKANEVWEKLLQSVNDRIDQIEKKAVERIAELEDKNKQLAFRVQDLKQDMKRLTKENKQLIIKIKELTKA